MSSAIATLLLASTATPAPELARLHGLVGTDGISITGHHLFSEVPPLGFHPVALEIRNDSAASHTWRIRTRAERGYPWSTSDVRTMELLVSVGSGEVRRFEILMPLPGPKNDPMGQMSARIEIAGYGVSRGLDSTANRVPAEHDAPRPTVGMSPTVGAHDPNRFAASTTLRPIHIFPNVLPADWRAYLGLDAIWLDVEDVRAIGDDAEAAILDWVAQGGQLFISGAEGSIPAPPYGLRRAIGLDGERFGLGRIAVLAWPGAEIGDAAAAAAVSIPIRDALSRQEGVFHKRFDPITVNRALMLIFMIVLGAGIGPINLFVLAPPKKRWRLLWTTPLISFAASIALVALILIQDGVGGAGHRRALVLSMPSRNREVVTQEQVSRTGVLLSRLFSGLDAAAVDHIDIEGGDTTCTSSARGHAGDFFRTRRVQGQRIQRVEASRSRIELVEDRPPKIASTFPDRLERLFYVAPDGAVFVAEGVERGARLELVESSTAAIDAFLMSETSALTPLAYSWVRSRWAAPGWFYAASAGAEHMAPTLRSIDWTGDRTLILGPVGGL
jgi:hypothetical protein